ncbi:MFS transporter [Candidatus Woesearchaeota archaeon]|nr:MFS transporter [Candidatus Woesearchaeota archaeon]MBI2581739.1 MFS transporter [Candidatus Woesearchaeota archaeon]
MVMFKKGEWKLFGALYSSLFLGMAMPNIYVVQALFFLSRGISLTELGIGFAIIKLFRLISEVPTGAIADLYGKKVSIQIQLFFYSICSFLFLFVTRGWHMYLLFAVEGVAGAFASGAYEALPYEIAKKAKRTDLINEYAGKGSFLREVAHFISYFGAVAFLFLVGGETVYTLLGISFKGLDLLWIPTSLGFLIAFVLMFKVKEEVVPRKVNLKQDFIDTYRVSVEGLKYAKSHPVISKLFAASFFFAISFFLFDHHVHQPFLQDLGFNAESIALLTALASLVGAGLSLIPKSIEKRFKTEKHFLEFTVILQLILLAGLFFFNKIFAFGVLFFFIYYNIHRSFREPIFGPFKQLFMKDEIRATIGSVESLIISIGGIIFLPLAGYLVDTYGAINTTLSAFIPLALGLIVLYTIKMNGRVNH